MIENIVGYFSFESKDIMIGENNNGKDDNLAYCVAIVEKIKAKMEYIDAYDTWFRNEIISLKMVVNELLRDL